jgi:hypothetical protein
MINSLVLYDKTTAPLALSLALGSEYTNSDEVLVFGGMVGKDNLQNVKHEQL